MGRLTRSELQAAIKAGGDGLAVANRLGMDLLELSRNCRHWRINPPRLSPATIEQLLPRERLQSMIQADMTLTQIALQLRMSESTVRDRCRALGLKSTPAARGKSQSMMRQQMSDLMPTHIVNARLAQGATISDLAEEFRLAESTVTRRVDLLYARRPRNLIRPPSELRGEDADAKLEMPAVDLDAPWARVIGNATFQDHGGAGVARSSFAFHRGSPPATIVPTVCSLVRGGR